MILRKMIENLLDFLIKIVFPIITFPLTWFLYFQTDDNTPATSQNYKRHSITNKLYSLSY